MRKVKLAGSERALTAEAHVVTKHGSVGFRTVLQPTLRVICHSVLAQSDSHDGRVRLQVDELRLSAQSLSHHALMDIGRCVMTLVHGSATAFDPRPRNDITHSEVVICVGNIVRKLQTGRQSVEAPWDTGEEGLTRV